MQGINFDDFVVPEDSARFDMDMYYTIPEKDHFEVCKHTRDTDGGFQLLVNFVRQNVYGIEFMHTNLTL